MSDSETNWQDLVVGDRMAVDNDFNREVEQSQFSRQQWGLVMTATEFHIEHPADEERARIVADASNVAAVLSEFENVEQAQAIGAAGGAGGSSRQDSGGLVDSIKSALGLGGGGGRSQADDGEAVEAAQRLTQSYADALQRRLEDKGRWDEVRAAARD
jgi:hypothetical protein